MVTKQQQLAWLAKHWDEWVSIASVVPMSKVILGGFTSMSSYAHEITKEEWQQQREKMASYSSQLHSYREKAIDAACKAIDGVIGDRLIIERLYDAGILK